MKNENWAAQRKLHAGGDAKLGIEFAMPKGRYTPQGCISECYALLPKLSFEKQGA